MSAETSGQLICRGVGQNVSPRERIDISSGAPNENIVQNHLDIALLNVF